MKRVGFTCNGRIVLISFITICSYGKRLAKQKPNIMLLLLTLFLVAFPGCDQKTTTLEQPDMLLWFERPAEKWVEALPVGNGRLGAMVYGGPFEERIQVNEESLWAGQPINNNNPEALSHLNELRRLLLEEKCLEAQDLVARYFIGTPPRIRSYQTAGNILISADSTGPVENYHRELILETGIARTTYTIGEINFTREVFASAPDNVIVIRIKADQKKSLNLKISLKREKDAETEITADGRIIMTGQIIDQPDSLRGEGGKHMKFAAILQAYIGGGELKRQDDHLQVVSANNLTLIYTAATDYNIEILNFDRKIKPADRCNELLNNLKDKSYKTLKIRHSLDHAALFNRVKMKLGQTDNSGIPTDKRLAAVKQGKDDPGLCALYFQYGRYLLMGSSRNPGVLPANLQGIWNQEYKAPWNSDFHTNINLQMNYWHAEVANLPETILPLSNFFLELMKPGGITAKEMYGADGWTMHHLTDPFGRTGVADGPWGLTPLNGPWMTFPLWRHFEFTLDTGYLQQYVYPLMKGATLFVLDFLVAGPDGYMVTVPSHSPENNYRLPGESRRATLTFASTIDIQIVRALFENTIEAAEILQQDPELGKRIKTALSKLPPVKTGSDGTIQEWYYDYDEVNPGHRHMSHLLGLYPLDQINPQTPELYEAARKTIMKRLSSGGGHTGWSRAWIINFFARLHDGNAAYKHLHLLLQKSTLDNLFDTHPPFQIDGNFGGAAGIAEMLLQSTPGVIELLPALPDVWQSGYVTGLVARGGVNVDLKWDNLQLIEAKLKFKNDQKITVSYKGIDLEIQGKKEKIVFLDNNLEIIE